MRAELDTESVNDTVRVRYLKRRCSRYLLAPSIIHIFHGTIKHHSCVTLLLLAFRTCPHSFHLIPKSRHALLLRAPNSGTRAHRSGSSVSINHSHPAGDPKQYLRRQAWILRAEAKPSNTYTIADRLQKPGTAHENRPEHTEERFKGDVGLFRPEAKG